MAKSKKTKPAAAAAQTNLPFEAINNYKLGARNDIDKIFKRASTRIYKIPLDNVVFRDGFNIKQYSKETIEQVADSLEATGQLVDCIGDILANNHCMLVDGHKRYFGMLRLRERNEEKGIKTEYFLRCIKLPTETTDIDRILIMGLTQDNQQFSQTEWAAYIQLLVDAGMPQKDIAKKFGRTDAWVSQLMKYNREIPEIKELVDNGKISVSAVVKLNSQVPDADKRLQVITETLQVKKTATLTPVAVAHDDIEDDDRYRSDDGQTLEPGEGVERNANYKSRAKDELDTVENASGPAHRLPKNTANERVNVSDVAKLSKRKKIEGLVDNIDEKYALNLDEDGRIELFNLIVDHLNG